LATASQREARSRKSFEDAALTVTAQAVAAAALARTETRGCHHRDDFPGTDANQEHPLSIRHSAGAIAVAAPTGVC
jgi:L-aspartate oxidase